MSSAIKFCQEFCRATAVTAAAFGLIASAPVLADVYRCERDGVVRYTDKPCDPAARPIELREPIVVPAGQSADFSGAAQQRRESQRSERDKADAAWVETYAARKEAEEAVRAGRVTATVVEGMSPADVRRIHGEPAVVSRSRGGKTDRETWSYSLDNGKRLHVTFTDGHVSAVRSREEKK